MAGAHEHHHHHDHGACDHARDRSAQADAILAEIERACAARDLRLTPLRASVLRELVSTHQPLGAYDLIGRLTRAEGQKLAPVSVYRALDFLVANGFAHKLESRNAFVACPHRHAPDDIVVFLYCEACGGVDEVESQPVRRAIEEVVRAQSFEPHHRAVEIAGLCSHCRR